MLGFETYDTNKLDGSDGVILVPLKFDMPIADWRRIKRADLVFEGVRHVGLSYEVRTFLNNKSANAETKRLAKNGYAGRFVVFGHGECFGESGHCATTPEVTRNASVSSAPQLVNPAAPHRHLLTITSAMTRILTRYKNGLHTVALVTVSKAPLRKDRGGAGDLFSCSRVSLQLYS